MGLDVSAATAVLDQVTAEISAFLHGAGQQGIDRPAQWLRAQHLQELRRIMTPVQQLLETPGELPSELRPRLDSYKVRLLELQAILQEMNTALQQGTAVMQSRQEDLVKLRLWLATYRNLR